MAHDLAPSVSGVITRDCSGLVRAPMRPHYELEFSTSFAVDTLVSPTGFISEIAPRVFVLVQTLTTFQAINYGTGI